MITAEDITPLSAEEKARASLLVAAPDILTRERIRSLLQSQGYGSIAEAADQKGALQRIGQRNFTHVIFSIGDAQIPATEFAKRVLNLDPRMVLIALHHDADGETMFSLLQSGVRGFMVYPPTGENIEAAIAQATHGKLVPEAVLHARDRNRALSYMLGASLDEAAEAVREHGYEAPNAPEAHPALQRFRRSARVARAFAAGGLHRLLESLQQFLVQRDPQPLTRLGRLRRRLQAERDAKYGADTEPAERSDEPN